MGHPAASLDDLRKAALTVATLWVCPIDGCLPADNGTDTSKTNNGVPAIPVIGTITTTGSAGSTHYSYKVSALFVAGESPASAEATVTTGNATLTTGNFNVIPWTAIPGAIGYNVYGNTLGAETLIASVGVVTNYHDVGVAPGATTPPTTYSFTPKVQCPICGCAAILVSTAKVTTITGVSSGSQHPLDVNATYGANSTSLSFATGVSPYTLASGQIVYPHGYATTGGNVIRGATVADLETNFSVTANTVTPETINSTVGP